jgi:pimeloyl-ACP methyl ester carboxylesterase
MANWKLNKSALIAAAVSLAWLLTLAGLSAAEAAVPITYDPEYRYANLSTGIKIAYVELGKPGAPPVVLIHGVTDSFLSFSQVAPRITAAGFRVIVPELRGHGRTDKPREGPYTIDQHTDDINALLSKLGVKKAHVTGHSLGSFIAQTLAIQYPDRVASLTLIGSAGNTNNNEVLAWLREGDDEFPGINNSAELSDEFLADWTVSSNYDEEFVKRTLEHAKRLPRYVWVNAFNGITNYPDRLKEITVPVQIIHGADDTIFSKQDQIDLIGALGSWYILFQSKLGIGHNTHWEGHLDEEVSSDILNFLASVRPKKGRN